MPSRRWYDSPVAASDLFVCVGLVSCFVPGCQPPPSPAPAPPAPVEVSPADEPPPEVAPTPNAPTCARAPGWRYERIELPPPFAPTLPKGVETLWFAPGMFDPNADDYFTYAFSLDWDGELAPEPAAVEAWLTDYFRGLMSAVAKARDAEPVRPATVTVSPDGTTAEVIMSDEFTETPEIALSLRRSGDAGCVRFWATAKPTEAVWEALREADSCLCTP